MEDFVNEIGLAQFRVACRQSLQLLVDLLLLVELIGQLTLVVIHLLPDLLVLVSDLLLALLKI